ncbi:unnamed protein product [Miscanthus lutarioriparius]|uniref:Uncharacterized protein n=1 Tax=Miscanthus lutarioriparius TaxID=422564 RepID=A0A811QJM7_9POAL|nr:unnamed protein product [Miscanthus lutarioriparius]
MASRGRHRHHIKEEQAPVLECHPSTDLALTGEEVPDPAMTPVDLATDAEEYAQFLFYLDRQPIREDIISVIHGMDTKDGLSVDAASRIVDAFPN